MSSAAAGKSRIDLVFNRPGVFSAEECDALIGWAEAQQSGGLERIDHELRSLEREALIRRNRQLVAPPGARDPGSPGFEASSADGSAL
jgi:hypothetical protein